MAIYVGPSSSRPVRGSLPTGTSILVNGWANGSDGSRWWNIHAPDGSSEVDRYWVNQAEVDATGGCEFTQEVPTSIVITLPSRITPSRAPTRIGTPVQDSSEGSDQAGNGLSDEAIVTPVPEVFPGGEEPGGESPGGEDPGGEDPNGENPGGEEPSGGETPDPSVCDYVLISQQNNGNGTCRDCVTVCRCDSGCGEQTCIPYACGAEWTPDPCPQGATCS